MFNWIRGRILRAAVASPAGGGVDPGVAGDLADVEAVIHETAERWNSQDYASVLGLWDPDEAVPFYLAEEQRGWFFGWEPLKAYLDPPKPSPAVQGIREEMRNVQVKLVAPGVAVAAWEMHFEMKIIGRPPIGEEVRTSAVLRKTPPGGATSIGPSRP
jgi:hypothetical protein